MKIRPTIENVTALILEGKSASAIASVLGCTHSHVLLFIKKNNIPYDKAPGIRRTPARAKTKQGMYEMPVPRKPMVDLYPVEVRQATPEELAALEKIPRPTPMKYEMTTGRRK